MKKLFNSKNMRFLIGDLVYYHSGEIKSFPVEAFQEPFGKVVSVISPESVEVKVFNS